MRAQAAAVAMTEQPRMFSTVLTRICLAALNCACGLAAVPLANNYNAVRPLAAFSLILFAVLLFRHLDNILFFGRTLFLGLVGYYPIAVKLFAGDDALFSIYEPSTQSLDIVVVMYVGTSLALFGNEIGLAYGSRRVRRPARQPVAADPELWRTIFHVAIPVIILVSVLVSRSNPTVFTAVYGSEFSEGYLLGNTQNIAIIFLLAMLVALHKRHIRHGRVIFATLSVIFVVWALFIRGFRQDVVTTLFGLAVCYGLVRGRALQLTVLKVLSLFALFVVVEFMGVARGLFAVQWMTLGEIGTTFVSTLFNVNGAYHFGTVSPDATTFANIVYLVKSHTIEPLWGLSYWEFVSRTLPAFITPNRPRDYAWIFPDYGLGAGGGIFELAEAYMNFGLLGTFVVPAVISFLMARTFVNALRKQTPLAYWLAFAFLGIFMRGALYQTFAFYKSFLTAMILLSCCVIVHRIKRRGKGRAAVAEREWPQLADLGTAAQPVGR